MTKHEIGTHGYYSIGSDAYPVTLVKQSKSGKVIYVQQDEFEGDKEAGHDYFGTQKWKYKRNPNGRILRFDWSEKRQKYSQGGVGCVKLGEWFARMDPHF